MTDIANPRNLKFAILESLSKEEKQHKINMLGSPHQNGSLECFLGIKFEQYDRVQAARAFDSLKRDGLIEPTYADTIDPENWVQLTEAGRNALSRQALDDLDNALLEINPHLVEVRAGAWAAAWSAQPDTLRQSAHSGRELIDQTLKAIATDEEVKEQHGFQPEKSSSNGVTRRQRIRFAMKKKKGRVSDKDSKIAEKACELVLSIDDKLKAFSHLRTTPDKEDVTDALQVAEIALRRVIT